MLVKRPCAIVERLDDYSARTYEIGCGQGSFPCVDDQVRAQTPALIVRVNRELPQQDRRNRIRHISPDARRYAAPLDRTGREAVKGDYRVAIADHVGTCAASSLVEAGPAS